MMKTMRLFAMVGVLSFIGASGAFANEQGGGACSEDIKKLCGDPIRDGKSMHECMKSNEAALSQGCKDEMASRKKMFEAKSKEVEAACQADIKQYCGNVTPGEGRMMACLKSYEDKVSAGCKEKLPRGMHHGKGMKGPMGDKPEPPTTPK